MAGHWNEFTSGFVWAVVFFALVIWGAQHLNFKRYFFKEAIQYGSSLTERSLFWGLMFIALLVRAWQFGDVPAGFNQDGAMAAVDAKALADYGTDRFGMYMPVHFTAWGYGQMSVLLSYLMVPFIKIGGLNEITARLPALIFSMAGIWGLYGLVKRVWGGGAAIVALLLVAINPWHIMQSRWALDCNMFPHFMILGCYFLHASIEKKKLLYLSMFFFAMSMYCYGIAFFTVPLFLLITAAYALIRRLMNWKEIAIAVSVYVFFAWPIWAVMVINFFKVDSIATPFFTIPYFPDSVRSGDILFFSDNMYQQLSSNFSAMMNTLFLQGRDLPWNALDDFGTQYQFALPFVFLGLLFVIYQCFVKRVEGDLRFSDNDALSFGKVIVLTGVFVGVWTGLIINAVNVNRINVAYYFLIILASLGVYSLWRLFKIAFCVSVAAYVLFFCLFCHHYFGKWSDEIGRYYFAGMGQALEAASEIDTPKYYVTVNSQFNGARNVSEILTLFHHEVDAHYFQGASVDELDGALSSRTVAENKYKSLYRDRYVYINPQRFNANPQERAAYIVKRSEQRYFSGSKFDFHEFGEYSLVTPRKM